MAKISMAKAAKMFAVSRPTLAEHLKKGKISGTKTGETWQLDMAELQRVYGYRNVSSETAEKPLPANLSAPAVPREYELESKIKLLETKLEAAEKLAEERAQHLDDLRNRLEGPQSPAQRRRWWPW